MILMDQTADCCSLTITYERMAARRKCRCAGQGESMKKENIRKNAGVYMMLAAGALLRLFYVIFSTIYERQYDIGQIDLDAGQTVSGGHLAYIQYIYQNGMPDFDPTSVYQFHHPPVHHGICAAWLKIASLFIRDTAVLEESIQVVPFVCSLLTLWMLYRVVRQFDLTEKAVCFVTAIFAFHPALVLLAGSVNNDCMALLFTVLIVYWTIRWSRDLRMSSIVKLALCIGIGMLVKQNVAEMAFPVAAVFVYILVKKWADSSMRRKLMGQFAAFGLISIPIGMSFYVRNLVKFDMSMFWVYELAEDSWQYTGNVPVVNRFLWPVPAEMVDNLRNFRLGCGYNVWMQIIRTSVLGEWDMADVGRPVKMLAVLLMLVGAVLALLALISFVKVFVIGGIRRLAAARKNRGKEGALAEAAECGDSARNVVSGCADRIDVPCYLMFIIGYVVNMFCYLTFAYNYPQQCSMHFRYIEITLLFPAVALGFVLQNPKWKWFNRLAVLTLAGFAVCSVLMIGFWALM